MTCVAQQAPHLVALPRLKFLELRLPHQSPRLLLGLLCQPVVGLEHVPQQPSRTEGAAVLLDLLSITSLTWKAETSDISDLGPSSSESKDSAPKTPVYYKGTLKAAKTEALEKGKEKAQSHFLVETHGRPPSKLPVGATRQEKLTGLAHHVRSIDILKSFFNNEYGYSLGTFGHHYNNRAAAAAECIRAQSVPRAVHGGSDCVPRVSRSCSARRIRCACCLRMCP